MKKVLVSGGTGFVGKRIVNSLVAKGYQVYVLSRNTDKVKKMFNSDVIGIEWKHYTQAFDCSGMSELFGVINLVGESVVAKRWSEKQKKEILDSRVDSSKTILSTLKDANITPVVIVSTSAIGIYGKTFLKDVCEKWESAVLDFPIQSRKVILRVPVVLGEDGGMIKELLPIFNLGLGGKLGSGKQTLTWIHVEDLSDLFLSALEDNGFTGVIDAVARFDTTNKEFTEIFGKLLNKPTSFAVPKFSVRLLKGQVAEHLFEEISVKPEYLNKIKYSYKFPTIELALKNIVSKL